MSIQDEIKPCHRCGETACYDEDWGMILCGVCGYYLQQDSMKLEQLIKFWNTRKIEDDLERQLAEKEEISNKWQDRWRGEVSRNSELTKLIEDLEDRLAEARQNIYKFAEIALMEGKDEFGHSWEDFKLYVLDEQLKEKGDEY